MLCHLTENTDVKSASLIRISTLESRNDMQERLQAQARHTDRGSVSFHRQALQGNHTVYDRRCRLDCPLGMVRDLPASVFLIDVDNNEDGLSSNTRHSSWMHIMLTLPSQGMNE